MFSRSFIDTRTKFESARGQEVVRKSGCVCLVLGNPDTGSGRSRRDMANILRGMELVSHRAGTSKSLCCTGFSNTASCEHNCTWKAAVEGGFGQNRLFQAPLTARSHVYPFPGDLQELIASKHVEPQRCMHDPPNFLPRNSRNGNKCLLTNREEFRSNLCPPPPMQKFV